MSFGLRYKASDRMSDLIADNFMLLMVLSRFGIKLGIGDLSVQQLCERHGVDCDTFLAVANFISSDQTSYTTDDLPQFSLPSLIGYLQSAHSYFLDFSLPQVRGRLEQALQGNVDANVSRLILKFYDQLVQEVTDHMDYENKHVFTYVNQLLRGKRNRKYDIAKFARHHTQMDERLSELKNIIVKYYPVTVDNNQINSVLFDIYNCEQDLVSHRQVEDCLFVPAVTVLERRLRDAKKQ